MKALKQPLRSLACAVSQIAEEKNVTYRIPPLCPTWQSISFSGRAQTFCFDFFNEKKNMRKKCAEIHQKFFFHINVLRHMPYKNNFFLQEAAKNVFKRMTQNSSQNYSSHHVQ